MNTPQDEPHTPPRLTPEYVEAILDRIRDYALCSDLRMYAWAQRKHHEDAGAKSAMIDHLKSIEHSKIEFAEDAFGELQEFLHQLTTDHPPALADDEEEPISDSFREHLERTDAAVAELGVSDDVLATIAAVGIVVTRGGTGSSPGIPSSPMPRCRG